MTDYLDNLAARILGTTAPLVPRRSSRFEPAPPDAMEVVGAVDAVQMPNDSPQRAIHSIFSHPTISPQPIAPTTIGRRVDDLKKRMPEEKPPERTSAISVSTSAASDVPPLQERDGEDTAVMPVTTPAEHFQAVEAERREVDDRANAPVALHVAVSPHLPDARKPVRNPEAVERRPATAIRPYRVSAERLTRAEAPAQVAETTAPVIHVSIGRIEVRAVPAPAQRPPAPAGPTVTLDAYLRQRDGGQR